MDLKHTSLLVASCVLLTTATPAGNAFAQSAALQQAIKRYEKRDYHGASIAFHAVAESRTHSKTDRDRAAFWLGKTLYHLGLYFGSITYFDAVQRNKKSRYRLASLKWLASLGRKLSESAVLNRFRGFTKSDLESPALARVKDELFYLLGRYRYGRGSFAKAIALFDAVSAKSPLYAKAKFMAGVTHVRTQKAKPAAIAFKAVLRHAKQTKGASRAIKAIAELAQLNLARLFYSVKQHKHAIKYYDRVIAARSKHRLVALMEQSWPLYRAKSAKRALKNLRAVTAATGNLPEARILEAMIHFQSKRRGAAKKALKAFFAAYPPLLPKLSSLLAKKKDPLDFFPVAKKLSKLAIRPSLFKQLLHHTLSAKPLQRAFREVDQLNRELKKVQQAPASWKATAVAGVVLQALSLIKSLSQNSAGQLAQRRIKALIRELRGLIKQGRQLELEVKRRRKKK